MLVSHPLFPAYAHAPPRLLPLSPLSPNVLRINHTSSHQPFQFGMTTGSSDEGSIKSDKSSTYSRRPTKPTPFSNRTRDEQRQRQRDIFLRRVEQTRDDKRWEGRSEEILRCDHFAQQRRRQEAYERSGDDNLLLSIEAESARPDSSLPHSSYGASRSRSPFHIYSDGPESEVDLVAQQERQEVEDWTAFLAERQQVPSDTQHTQQENETQTTDYDDDEYDDLFMDLIDQQPVTGEQQQPPDQDTEMDMSL